MNINRLNKVLSILIVTVIIIGMAYVIYMIFSPYIYTTDYEAKNECLDSNMYIVANNIVLKKYEVILYEEPEGLFNLYSYNNKSKIEKFISNDNQSEIKKYYENAKVDTIYTLPNNIYLVKYNIFYSDGKIINEIMIIKYLDNKACIVNDTMLEG